MKRDETTGRRVPADRRARPPYPQALAAQLHACRRSPGQRWGSTRSVEFTEADVCGYASARRCGATVRPASGGITVGLNRLVWHSGRRLRQD